MCLIIASHSGPGRLVLIFFRLVGLVVCWMHAQPCRGCATRCGSCTGTRSTKPSSTTLCLSSSAPQCCTSGQQSAGAFFLLHFVSNVPSWLRAHAPCIELLIGDPTTLACARRRHLSATQPNPTPLIQFNVRFSDTVDGTNLFLQI